MALINTIREKMGTFVVVLVGVAILSFVVADLLGPGSSFFNDTDRTVGEIAGEEVSLEEFQRKMDELEVQMAMQNGNQTLTEQQRAALRNQAWEALVAQKSFNKQYEKLGLETTNEEVVDMVQGNNISPSLKASFINPETGEFDRSELLRYLQNVKNMPKPQQDMWYAFEASLRPARQRIKYENLLLKSNYVTTAEAKREHKSQNTVAEVQYLYVPFYAISDSAITVTDAELKNYLEKNKENYQTEGGRNIKYVSFSVKPSAEDREVFMRELNKLKADFAKAENDSLFALRNTEGRQAFGTYAPDQLPTELKNNTNILAEGEVYGPFMSDGNYALYKVTEIAEDTVSRARASHILISAPESSSAEEKKAAREKAEALLKILKAGEDFATLARENSSDPSSSRGGDLGWFSEGRMVEPFEKAVFGKKEAGLVDKVVETSYGYHLINVTEAPVNTVYKVAKVEMELAPSQNTRNQAYRKAELFAASADDVKDFENLVKKDSLQAATAKNVGPNESRINDLYDARNVVMWAYKDKTSVGDVSPVFELEDKYIVAAVTGKTEKGLAKPEDVREEIIAKVKNEKKASQIKEKLNSLTGTIEEKAKAFGSDANVYNAPALKRSDFSLPTIGYAPAVVGTAFGLNEGETSAPVEAQNGVVIVKTIAKNEAADVADYSSYKDQLAERKASRAPYQITEAVKNAAEVEDRRYKFF